MSIDGEFAVRIMVIASSPEAWKTSKNMAERMVAYIVLHKWDRRWRDRLLWKEGIPPLAKRRIKGQVVHTHYTSVEILTRYSLRLGSWKSPKVDSPENQRRMKEPSYRNLYAQVRAAYRAGIDDGVELFKYDTQRMAGFPGNGEVGNGQVRHVFAVDYRDEFTHKMSTSQKWMICRQCFKLRWPQRQWMSSNTEHRVDNPLWSQTRIRELRMEHMDYSRVVMVAKEIRTTVSWVPENIKIVVPRGIIPALTAALFALNSAKTLYSYIVLNAEEEAFQAAWEIDKDNGRTACDYEVNEHRKYCWDSISDPWSFAPAILFPSSHEWNVRITITRTGDDGGTYNNVDMWAHPSTTIAELAHMAICCMKDCDRTKDPKMNFLYNDETCGPNGSSLTITKTRATTIASMLLPSPIVIWYDNSRRRR